MSDSQEQNSSKQTAYNPPIASKSKSKPKPKSKGSEVNKQLSKPKNISKQQKAKKQKPEMAKKVAKKKKQAKQQSSEPDFSQKSQVADYMLKQNRPYNLLNIFDNLHGKIKKNSLQIVLNELTEEEVLTCKEFGKNKVYFANQSNQEASVERIEQMGREYSQMKAKQSELSEIQKKLADDLKKIMSRKPIEEIKSQINDLKVSNSILENKKHRLINENSQKIDQNIVYALQNQQKMLKKELTKRKKLTKQGLAIWSQILEKKVEVVAQLMGIDL